MERILNLIIHSMRKDTDLPDGIVCNKISIKYPDNKPYFIYDPEDKQYLRFQFGRLIRMRIPESSLHLKIYCPVC